MGSSWAAQSFDLNDEDPTNLAKLWGTPCITLAKPNASNLHQIAQVKKHHIKLPLIWFFCEPAIVFQNDSRKTETFLMSPYFMDDHKEEQYNQLRMINNLNLPVALIGSHCDIMDDVSEFKNLEVIAHSWQNFLATKVGMAARKFNWGYEVGHKIFKFSEIQKPSINFVEEVSEGLQFWKELENRKVFFEVHPNKLGNIMFAEHLKTKIENFIVKHSK